jgi:hypothetical protein
MRISVACVALIVLAISFSSVRAQDEDQGRFCPIMSAELVKKVAAEVKGAGRCQVRCDGCGCQGGPGFRSLADGQCVGWASVISKCGPAPHLGCTWECTPVVPACIGVAKGRAWLKEFAATVGIAVKFSSPQTAAAK